MGVPLRCALFFAVFLPSPPRSGYMVGVAFQFDPVVHLCTLTRVSLPPFLEKDTTHDGDLFRNIEVKRFCVIWTVQIHGRGEGSLERNESALCFGIPIQNGRPVAHSRNRNQGAQGTCQFPIAGDVIATITRESQK